MGAGWRKILKNFFQSTRKTESEKSEKKFELNPDDNKSEYFSNPYDIFKSIKKCYEKLYTMGTTSKAATAEFLSKIHNITKISIEQFHLCELKIIFR